MASMRDIKRRKNSVTSTQQITKAMKLVSTVKLQKARVRAEKTNPYTDQMYKTVSSMMRKSGNINHPYLTAGDPSAVRAYADTSWTSEKEMPAAEKQQQGSQRSRSTVCAVFCHSFVS